MAEDGETDRELASGYGLWVRSIRAGEGAIPFPTPDEASAHIWTEKDRALVTDRVDTQFVGTSQQVADQLELLRDATGADELIITTITPTASAPMNCSPRNGSSGNIRNFRTD